MNYEKVLAGAAYLNPDSVPALAATVKPEMLSEPWSSLYRKAVEQHAATGTVDVALLKLPKPLLEAWSDATESCLSPSNAELYARAVRDKWKRYAVAKAAEEVIQACRNGADEDAAVAKVVAAAAGYDDAPKPGKLIESVKERRALVRATRLSGRHTTGIPTGFPTLDRITDGIQPGHLWVAGGYTSAGKSYLAINVAAAALADGKGVSFVTLEMSPEEIAARASAHRSGVPSRWHELTPEQEEARESADRWVAESNLRIVTVPDLSGLVFEIRRAEREGRSLVVIDYLQLVKTAPKDSTYDAMRKVAQELQARLRGSSVAVLALSQVSNEGARNPSETIDFKGAGDIAASADVAILLRSAHTAEERAERSAAGERLMVRLDVRKNRHGAVGAVPVALDGRTGRMEEVRQDSVDAVFFTK